MNITKFLLSLLMLTLLVACKSNKPDSEIVVPAQVQYDKGIAQFEKGEFKKAANEFERIFFEHPGNPLTPLAELMQAYSLYRANEFEETIDVLDIFIKLHPRHEYISYAYYLKALSSYVQISEVKLDQSRTLDALEALTEVINKFPHSKYALDSALKMDLVRDHLAGHEMLIGRYYLSRKNPIAAIKRFQAVIADYNTTSHTPEALHRLVESSIMLGLNEEAGKYLKVLAHNYPNSRWYKYSANLLK